MKRLARLALVMASALSLASCLPGGTPVVVTPPDAAHVIVTYEIVGNMVDSYGDNFSRTVEASFAFSPTYDSVTRTWNAPSSAHTGPSWLTMSFDGKRIIDFQVDGYTENTYLQTSRRDAAAGADLPEAEYIRDYHNGRTYHIFYTSDPCSVLTGVLYEYRQVTPNPTIENPNATEIYAIDLVTAYCTASNYLEIALYDPNDPLCAP